MKKIISKANILLATIISVSAFLALLNFNSFQTGAYYDDAHYIVLAESLGSGQGYRLINFPNAPLEWAFPRGWPLLLSQIVTLFPKNYQILKFISLLFWLASLILLHRLFVRHIKTPYLELLITLIALNPNLISASTMVMSESAYLFFSISTIYIFDLWSDYQERGDRKANWLILAFIISIAVYTHLIRTVGISILIALMIYLFISRKFRQAGVVTIVLIIGMFPQFLVNIQRGGGIASTGYQEQVFNSSIADKFLHVWLNLQYYINQTIASSLIPIFSPSIKSVLAIYGLSIMFIAINIFTLALISIGILISIRKLSLSVVYVGFYFLGILSFWNPEVGSAQARFLIPIIPFLYFYLFQAVIWLTERIFSGNRKVPVVLVIVFSFSIILISVARNIQNWRNPVRDRMTDLSIGTTWIAKNTPSESIIMSVNPISHYLYANRKTVAYPKDNQNIEQYIRDNGIDYIIVSRELEINNLNEYTVSFLIPELTSKPNKYYAVFVDSVHDVTVYAVVE